MTNEAEIRRREMALLMERVTEDLVEASGAMADIGHAEDSAYRQGVEDAALDSLRAMREVQDSMYSATRTLACALTKRGTPIARVARALGVSRGTILNWKAELEPESDHK